MRTTLDLPDGLVEEAREAIGYKSKTDTVVYALKEIIRRKQKDELKDFITKIQFDFDPTELRKKERQKLQQHVRGMRTVNSK
jgi:outer membrane protein OmpA-like peptidoglycan-associated protein